MQVHTKEEFWNLNKRKIKQKLLKVDNPKVVRSILIRHYLLKTAGIVLFLLAMLTPVIAIWTGIVPNITLNYQDNIPLNLWPDVFQLFKSFAPIFILVLTLSITGRMVINNTIQGSVKVTLRPAKLIVTAHPPYEYHSRLLGLKFKGE